MAIAPKLRQDLHDAPPASGTPIRSSRLNRYYNAFAAYHTHFLPQRNVRTVGRNSLPVVPVDGYTAVAIALDGLAHLAYTAYQRIGIAQPFAPFAVKPLDKPRPYEEQRENRHNRENLQLHGETASHCRYDSRDKRSNGKTQDEKVARSNL
jgi:hypothetical protein